MKKYYPLRRVPHTVPRSVLWRELAPLAIPILRSARRSVLAKVPFSPPLMRETLEEHARAAGDEVAERAQHIFFENPGLDTMLVRLLNRTGRTLVHLGRLSLLGRIVMGMDHDGRLRTHVERLPVAGYDSLMVTGLAVGTALGYFRGGRINSIIWWDSADPDPKKRRELPPGHPHPGVRRFQIPRSLGDLAADIDDLYWAQAYGQAVKVTRVGEGDQRRWLVSLPGTDHSEPESGPNPADLESNMREELNIPSAMRLGTIQVIKNAMTADGLTPEEMVRERVLICGHSQGGMVAVALASTSPEEVGFTVDGVLTLGSPTRRFRLREDVEMLAVEHTQDIIPALDGTPRRESDQRVVVERALHKPLRSPLFYSHDSSTYTESVRRIERETQIVPWGRTGKVVDALHEYLPREGEVCRVTHHYTWQDLAEPTKVSPLNTYLELDLPGDWAPVAFDGEIVASDFHLSDPPIVPSTEEIKEKAAAILRKPDVKINLFRHDSPDSPVRTAVAETQEDDNSTAHVSIELVEGVADGD